MDLFIQHLLSQCVVRVRPQQSHVGCSFNVKTDTEAITVKGRWSIRRGNTWLWRDPRLRAWHRLSSRGSFLEEAVFKLSLERWVGVFQESIIPDRRSSQVKRKCARDVKAFQSIFSYRVALSLRGWAWEQVCPELYWGVYQTCVCDSACTEWGYKWCFPWGVGIQWFQVCETPTWSLLCGEGTRAGPSARNPSLGWDF